jgi:hypothetical protein
MYQSETGPSANGSTASAVDEEQKANNGNGFLAELAHAMQLAAASERERATTDLDAAVAAHLERVRAREASEAAELRRMAEVDIDEIHAWSKAEVTRIREETARRISVRGNQLDDYLVRHAAMTDDEVVRIDDAVADYRVALDGYFGRLTTEPDPREIARLADELPEAPDLSKIGGEARANALAAVAAETTGPAPVPVMDPEATAPTTPAPAPVAAPAAKDETKDADAKPAEDAKPAAPTQRSLWQSIAQWAAPPETTEPAKPSEPIGSGGTSAQR